jgi:cyclopropane fatty-acyl-phospholipid synthase-like methyltransferase
MSDSGATVPARERFVAAYSGSAPWDIGKVQSAFQEAAEKIAGSILDAGCGRGDNALFFASRGHAVTGMDFLDAPVASAKRKTLERGLAATFLIKDALGLHEWNERFDNVIDSGLFHVFADEDRIKYVRGLKAVLKPGGRLFLLCFSDATPGTMGPRRVTKKELQDCFAEGWQIESIEPARVEVRPEARVGFFAGQEPRGWFMIARRAA